MCASCAVCWLRPGQWSKVTAIFSFRGFFFYYFLRGRSWRGPLDASARVPTWRQVEEAGWLASVFGLRVQLCKCIVGVMASGEEGWVGDPDARASALPETTFFRGLSQAFFIGRSANMLFTECQRESIRQITGTQ